MRISDKALFDKYYKTLCYFAWNMVKDQSVAEDLAQDAFVSYFQQKSQVSTDEQAIKGFLYSSVRFAVYNLSRKKSVINKFWQRAPFNEQDDIDFEYQIIETEFNMQVHAALQQLPDACQKVFRLGYFEGLTTQEIATELRVSANTVKTHKKRGLKVLRGILNPKYFTLLLLFLK